MIKEKTVLEDEVTIYNIKQKLIENIELMPDESIKELQILRRLYGITKIYLEEKEIRMEYLVKWEQYNKISTTYETGKFEETVEADSELDAIESIKRWIFDDTDKQEYPEIEITDDGVKFGEFEYCNFTATKFI